jgi:hypothetical protein
MFGRIFQRGKKNKGLQTMKLVELEAMVESLVTSSDSDRTAVLLVQAEVDRRVEHEHAF